jgi:hypothetical protein
MRFLQRESVATKQAAFEAVRESVVTKQAALEAVREKMLQCQKEAPKWKSQSAEICICKVSDKDIGKPDNGLVSPSSSDVC